MASMLHQSPHAAGKPQIGAAHKRSSQHRVNHFAAIDVEVEREPRKPVMIIGRTNKLELPEEFKRCYKRLDAKDKEFVKECMILILKLAESNVVNTLEAFSDRMLSQAFVREPLVFVNIAVEAKRNFADAHEYFPELFKKALEGN
ncbi:MAG: hypothetical protein D6769_03835 [Methanobacteriota archaeon]|nr:MAG: hypothetical protein D6769_03835 [Euryarchaeota archaeon]